MSVFLSVSDGMFMKILPEMELATKKNLLHFGKHLQPVRV